MFNDRDELLKLFAKNTASDFNSEDEILSVLKLATDLVGKPVQQVQFPGVEGPSYVTLEPGKLRGTVQRFLNAQGTKAAKGKPRASAKKKRAKDKKIEKKQGSATPPGLIEAKSVSQDEALPLATELRFPVWYPTRMSVGSTMSRPTAARTSSATATTRSTRPTASWCTRRSWASTTGSRA